MLGYKSKQISDEVLNYWIASADGFAFSSNEFYDRVEEQLKTLQVPGLEISRVEYAEGGLLSANRTYLRLLRERLAFDICAAPFGTRYFFTCRTVYSPVQLTLAHVMLTFLYLGLIFFGLSRFLDLTSAVVALGAIILTTWFMFWGVASKGLGDVDAALLKIPGLGPIYEHFFRLETYYRIDTRLMFLDTIPAVVQGVADEVTAAKGVKLVREFQSAPVLGDLLRPVPTRQPAAKK
jgi:hypothetical protein